MKHSYKDYIPVTSHMHKELMLHKTKTAMSGTRIYNYMRENDLLPPDTGITIKRIESWFTKIAQSVNKTDFDAVLSAYRTITVSDEVLAKGQARLRLDPSFSEKVDKVLKARPNLSTRLLLRAPDTPAGLTERQVTLIRRCRIKSIHQDHKRFLEKALNLNEAEETSDNIV